MDIMMRLKGSGFSVIANEFHDREKRLGGGLPLQDFVEIVLQGLPRAKSAEEKRANVSALVDLFDEIDINGDGVMEFDEFTSFCVDAGMVATRVKTSAAALKHRYVRSARHVIKTASGCVGIEKVKWSPEFKKLLALENTAKSVKLFDITGKFFAEVGGKSTLNVLSVTPRANESKQDWQGQGLSDTSGRSTERGRPQNGKPNDNAQPASEAAGSGRASVASSPANNTTAGIFILDAVFIFKYKWLALSTTDFCISFYDMDESRKPPVAALLPDSATAAARSGPSFELMKSLTITTTTAQLLLRFCEQAALLFSSGNDFVLNVWKILDAETKVLWKRLVLHQDMVMDLIEVPQHDMIVSCDLHKSIQLWDLHDCRSRGALSGHSHGVKQLVYSSYHDLLLSAGFEFDAYGWDIASRQVVMKLSGHRAPLVGVQVTLFQTERAVTADCMGVFKVWDISRGSGGMTSASSASSRGGHGTASQAIQLESIDPSQHFARFEPTAFICLHPHSRDLWTATAGTATLQRFRSTRVQQLDEIPLRAFYHYSANKFIVVAGPACSIWDGETGTCLEEFSHVGNISSSSSGKAGDNAANPGAGTNSSASSGSSSNSTVHNGSGSSTSSEPCVEVLACVQDQSCKKVVVVTERGELGVFNALNFVQMRKCQEVFYGQAKVSTVPTPTTTDGASNAAPAASAPTPGTGQPAVAVSVTKNRSCGIVGLHYCSVNKLIVATDANESAILVIDDNTNHDATRGLKDTTVLRRLTSVPGGISASAYGFHTCLVATVSDVDEAGDSSVSLWDFETLSFVGNCEFHREHEGHALHLLEFWDEFPVLLGADTLGGVYFYAAMPLINCNTGKLLHSFINDHDYASQPASKATGGARRKATGVIFENVNEDEEDERGDEDQGPEGKTFMTEATELAARKLLKWRKKSVASKENTAETTSSEPKPPGCAVACMKVVYDDANERYVLFTGDESGMVRLWSLTKMIARLSLSKIPEIKCKFLRRGYHPKAMLTRDYVKDTMANDASTNGYNKHQPLLTQGGDWRAALLTGDDHDPHFQLTQTDLKRLSRRRLESKKRSTVGVMVPSSKPQSSNRTAQQAKTATVAFAAAEAFLGAPKSVGAKSTGVGGLKKRSSLVSLSKASSTAQQRRHSQHQQFDDIQIVHAWKAHSDGLTSIEVTKNPAILVTCALDMRVFVWDWQGNCLGKLFDAENIGKWKWLFRKDDSKHQEERDELVHNLMRDLELTPLEKAHRRRQTLYQEHTECKSLKDMQKVNTILLDHIISKNPDLELLKTDSRDEEEDTRSGGSPAQEDALPEGGQSKVDRSKDDAFAQSVRIRQPPGGQQQQPLSSSTSSLHEPERVNHLRLHSLAQVGPLLCVNKFEYKKQSLATGKTKFAELDDLKMDKKYLEQELSISFPTSLSSSSRGGDGKGSTSHSNNLSDVQSQIQVAHVAAKAAFESRATLERKTADMYVNLEKVKHRAKKASHLQQQQKGGERVNQELDMELLEPSEFLKKHIPASKLSIRPQTAPPVQKRLQQIKKLPPSPSNQPGDGGARQTQSAANLPKHGDYSSALSLKSSISTPLLAPNQRQSVNPDRRKSSMDIGFMEEVKRHAKHKKPVVMTLASPTGVSNGKRMSALGRAGSFGSISSVGERPGDREEERGDGEEGGLSLRKLRAINQILSRAQQYCSPVKESTSMSNNNNRPSTAPFSRLAGKSTAISTGCNGPQPSVAQATKSDERDDDDDDPDHERENEDSFDMGEPTADDPAAADARVREHLESTKRRMASAMRDGEHSPRRSDLKKIRQSSREQQKARRMEDYLQQKRREMNTNIGNVFKRTSFAFQSKATDDPMATLAAANTANSSSSGTRPPKMDTTLSPSNKAKLDLEKSATVFGIYGVREVMSVIRLFWSMDEDGSGSISLEELLQYKHFFEKLGYNDMTTVFQAIDKDGNGHVSLKELLEICFHYATKYQIEEMLKLAKVGNVRSYLQGDGGGSGSGATGGKDATQALSQEHRRELLDIFRVFDKNGDGGVSMQELMEALRVDDDDVMAKVMAEEAARSKSSNWAATSSGITKEDVERLYGEFDGNRNAILDFDEFVALMRTLYGPKSNAYFR